jgi:hypothetical protein
MDDITYAYVLLIGCAVLAQVLSVVGYILSRD